MLTKHAGCAILAAATLLAAAPALSAPIVVKAHAISLGLGTKTHDPGSFFPLPSSIRLADVAVGTRLVPGFGLAAGVIGLEDIRTNEGLLNGTYTTVNLYAFAGPQPDNWRSNRLVFLRVGAKPWGRPTIIRAGLGASFTFWALNPEIELSYHYLTGRWDEYKPPQQNVFTCHQVGAFVSVGIGGWYEFARR